MWPRTAAAGRLVRALTSSPTPVGPTAVGPTNFGAAFGYSGCSRAGSRSSFGPLWRRAVGTEAGPSAASVTTRQTPSSPSTTASSASSTPSESRGEQLLPPRADADPTKARAFARRVQQALNDGQELTFNLKTDAATWHCVRAMSVGETAADFEVRLVPRASEATATAASAAKAGADAGEQASPEGQAAARRKELHLIIRKGGPWEEVSRETSEGHFVAGGTNATALARKLILELREKRTVSVHTFSDNPAAVNTMLLALALVREMGLRGTLLCTVVGFTKEGEKVPRVLVHASRAPPKDQQSANEVKFFPPGRDAAEDAVARFTKSVSDRLRLNVPVILAMECRGEVPTWHTLQALTCRSDRTSEFQVEWTEGVSGGDARARGLLIRAKVGSAWKDFHRLRKEQPGSILRPGSYDSDSVQQLARRLAARLQEDGAVALQLPEADGALAYRVLKALASVPVEVPGLRVVCVPRVENVALASTSSVPSSSTSSSSASSSAESKAEKTPVIFLYVRSLKE